MTSEWVEWHRDYDDPHSNISKRLRCVQDAIREALDRAPPGRIRLLSLCAGDGRDVLGVLPTHPRRRDVGGRLVDLDPELVRLGRERIRSSSLAGIEYAQLDASLPSSVMGAVPADFVLLCGIFGNLDDEDLHQFVLRVPELCAERATAIWTRHRRSPDLTPSIRGWFKDAGFEEITFLPVPGSEGSVGVARLASRPPPLRPEPHFFTFIPKALQAHRAKPAGAAPDVAPPS
jgi:hypothetical protein